MNLKTAARAALPLGVLTFVASALPTTEPAAATPPEPEPVDEGVDTAQVTVTEQTFDRGGNLVGTRDWTDEYTLDELDHMAPVSGSDVATAASESVSGGSGAIASGCRTLDVSLWKGRVYPGDTRVTYYVYHHNKSWCWNAGAGLVDRLSWYAYFTNVDPIWYDRGQIHSDSYHYAAWNGYSKSGHKTFTQRQIENCLLNYCFSVDHPWADVHTFADGAYWFNMGT